MNHSLRHKIDLPYPALIIESAIDSTQTKVYVCAGWVVVLSMTKTVKAYQDDDDS